MAWRPYFEIALINIPVNKNLNDPPPKKLDPECLVLPRLLELLEQSIWRANDITFLRWRRDFYWTKWSKVCGILLSHIRRYCKSNTLVTICKCIECSNMIEPGQHLYFCFAAKEFIMDVFCQKRPWQAWTVGICFVCSAVWTLCAKRRQLLCSLSLSTYIHSFRSLLLHSSN